MYVQFLEVDNGERGGQDLKSDSFHFIAFSLKRSKISHPLKGANFSSLGIGRLVTRKMLTS